MKKQLYQALICLILIVPLSCYAKNNKGIEARGVIERVVGRPLPNLILKTLPKSNDLDQYEYSAKGGRLYIKGSSGVAQCKAFYDFVKNHHYGMYTWGGNTIDIPVRFPDQKRVKQISPVMNHYYLNVCTYGYTMPYWDWKRWQQEIDWMALHGIDMPLALIANEAITERVFSKLGLSKEEINKWFTGPAHLPWMRMGNASGIDAGLPDSWHKDQVALQHKVLEAMRGLGMKPICPGFAGFVPKAMKEHYPSVDIVETSWSNFHNWMLSPEDTLFQTIGSRFIKEWEAEFGVCDYYLVDSFNEMEIPFPPKDSPKRYSLLADYGDKVYKSIKKGNPKATWVMQGWMFGYQRNIWDYKTLNALVSKVPDNELLLLDLAEDYNHCFWKNGSNWDFYKGFYNKQWLYSIIPNMGGKSATTGILSYYANGQLAPYKSLNHGNLVGMGMAPEGIENNEVVYELASDSQWKMDSTDLHQWIKDYCINRYGDYPEVMKKAWDELLLSVYGSFTDHPRFNWQFEPGTVKKGSINTNDHFYKAIEYFAEAEPQLRGSVLYKNDLLEFASLYLGAKLENLSQTIIQNYDEGQTSQAQSLTYEFKRIALSIDLLLDSHPLWKLDRWIDFARSHGTTAEEKHRYETNAKRIVTIWGPPVDDYSARIWSGLIRDYYLPRWENYFESRNQKVPFNNAQWEKNWVEKEGLSKVTPFDNPTQKAVELIHSVQWIKEPAKRKPTLLAEWTPEQVNSSTMIVKIPAKWLKSMTGVVLVPKNSSIDTDVDMALFNADGKISDVLSMVTRKDSKIFLPFEVTEATTGNNIFELKIKIHATNKNESYGSIEIVQ